MMANSVEASKKSAVAVIAVLVALIAVAGIGYAIVGAGGPSEEHAGGSDVAAQTQTGATDASGEPEASQGSESGENGTWNNPAMYALAMDDADEEPIVLGAACDGKVTVINLWATWCPYCIDEMQDYQDLYEEFGDRVQFVMLDSADSDEEVAAARDYIADQGFTFPVFYDTAGELSNYFGVYAYPTTIVIDANGDVLNNAPGRISKEGMRESLAELVS